MLNLLCGCLYQGPYASSPHTLSFTWDTLFHMNRGLHTKEGNGKQRYLWSSVFRLRVLTLSCPVQTVWNRITAFFGVEGTLKIILVQIPAMSRDTFCYPRLLRAPNNLAMDTSRDEVATASLGNLCQGLTTLRDKNSFLIPNLTPPLYSLRSFPLVLHSMPL